MKRVFITGVSDGLGLAMAREAIASGNIVHGVSRRIPPISEDTQGFTWMKCDVAEPAAIDAVLKDQRDIDWLPDVVILNAGLYKTDPPDGSRDAAEAMFRVNALGALRWVEAYLPMMKARGSGHIVYISSLSALYDYPGRAGYGASKAYASKALAALRDEARAHGVAISTVYLSLLDTAMSAGVKAPASMKMPPEAAARRIMGIAFGARGGWRFVPRTGLCKIALYRMMPRPLMAWLMKRTEGQR